MFGWFFKIIYVNLLTHKQINRCEKLQIDDILNLGYHIELGITI
jgi:hypothetical protein